MKYKGELKSTVIRTKAAAAAATSAEKKTSLEFIEKIQTEQQTQQQQTTSVAATIPRAPPPSKTIITGNRYKAAAATAAFKTSPVAEESSTKQLIQELPEKKQLKNQCDNSRDNQPMKPTFSITHRASKTYQNYLQTRNRTHTHPPRPDTLILRVDLPLCESAARLSINVVHGGWGVCIEDEVNNGHGLFEIDLPFEVVDGDGSTAKFDKVKRVLVVEFMCVPAKEEVLPESNVPTEDNTKNNAQDTLEESTIDKKKNKETVTENKNIREEVEKNVLELPLASSKPETNVEKNTQLDESTSLLSP
ncbi:hypothetical protein HK100_009196, partial [Physocladia obscura]